VKWTAALALLCSCSCGKPPPGYVRSHALADEDLPCLSWARRNITYAVDPAGSARTPGDSEQAAVDSSFATWQAAASACSDLTFTRDAGSPNLVVWRERSCAGVVPPNAPCLSAGRCDFAFNCWDESAATLALTTVTYQTSTGTLFEADIQLNGADWLFTTLDTPPCPKGMPAEDCVATDVQNTLTHEIGHLIGFDHSELKGSTMEATAPLGETAKRTIDDGTREGLCTVYPRASPSPSCLDGGQ
jgi:hypothetical protein